MEVRETSEKHLGIIRGGGAAECSKTLHPHKGKPEYAWNLADTQLVTI